MHGDAGADQNNDVISCPGTISITRTWRPLDGSRSVASPTGAARTVTTAPHGTV